MLVLPARAKLNLTLEVVGRRSDGFHDLRSVVVSLDWHDLVGVSVRRAPARSATLIVTGIGAPELPVGGGNLAHAAAVELLGLVPEPVHIDVWLDKHLPMAAGLGGGSSDAAAVLRAGSSLWDIDHGALVAAAERLGSDVPAAFAGGCLLVTGRGERITPVAPAPALHMAVVIAGRSSTPATFAALTEPERHGDGRADRVVAAVVAGHHPDPADLGSALEPAAVRANPDLGRALHLLRRRVPEGHWLLTGSGGAAFALAPTAAQATSLANRARDAAGLAARACHTVG